jgi:predicted transcriptional regulator
LANLASQNPANLRKGLDSEINDLVAKAYGIKPTDVEVLRVA